MIGSYTVGHQVVTIASFSPNLAIIASKQRPRRMTIFGNDGREYQFGLKGAQASILKNNFVTGYIHRA